MVDSKKETDVEVMGQEKSEKTDNKTIVPARFVFPNTLPILPLLNRPLFPKMMVPLLSLIHI